MWSVTQSQIMIWWRLRIWLCSMFSFLLNRTSSIFDKIRNSYQILKFNLLKITYCHTLITVNQKLLALHSDQLIYNIFIKPIKKLLYYSHKDLSMIMWRSWHGSLISKEVSIWPPWWYLSNQLFFLPRKSTYWNFAKKKILWKHSLDFVSNQLRQILRKSKFFKSTHQILFNSTA